MSLQTGKAIIINYSTDTPALNIKFIGYSWLFWY